MAKIPAGFNRCISGVQAAMGEGRELDEDDLIRLFQKSQGRIRRYEAAGMSRSDAAYRAGQEMGQEYKLAAAVEQRSRLINIARRRDIMSQIETGKEVPSLRRVLSRVDSSVYGLQAEVMGPLVAKMEKAGLLKVMSRGDKQFDQRVALEMEAITRGERGTTGDKLARQAAEIISEAQERVRLMQNEAGAYIGKLENYVARTSHDMFKVRGDIKNAAGRYDGEANFAKWRDFIRDKLDDRTFDSLDEITEESVNRYLRSVWRALSSGEHDTATGREIVSGFTGPGNLAKRVSHERKLIFRDGEWFNYNQEYGRGNLWEAVKRGVETGARNAALMRGLGTNPEAMFDGIVTALRQQARDRDDMAAVDALGKKFNKQILDTITGRASIAGNSTFANIVRISMTVQTLSKLGGVVLSSIPDLVNNAALLRHNGAGLFESYAGQFASLFPKSAEGREAMRMMGVGIDGAWGHAATRFTDQTGVQGRAAKMVDIFHRWNLLSWWSDSMKHGMGEMLTHNLARQSKSAWGDLNPRTRMVLEKYGIEAADWDVARATAAKGADGVERLLPAEIEDRAVARKFQHYLIDQIREGMNEPDAVSRTVATGGTNADTAVGMAMRAFMQFKTYPITFINRTLGREGLNPFAENFGKGMDAFGIGHLVVGTWLAGYVAMEMKNLAAGKNLRTLDATDNGGREAYAELLTAALLQGGGLGLFGDFLFGDSNRQGGGVWSSVLGPTAGTLGDLTAEIRDLTKWAIQGDERAGKDARSGAIGLLRNNAPFVNMFYTRWLANYLIWYRLQEASNPGYLRRYEERVRRENHQTFLLSPSASPYQ